MSSKYDRCEFLYEDLAKGRGWCQKLRDVIYKQPGDGINDKKKFQF